MNNKKIIVFDLDGVLIDSKKNMISTLIKTNRSLGLNIKFKDYEKYIGLPFKKILLKIGVKENFSKIEKNYKKFSYENISKLYLKKNIVNVLKRLKKEFDLGIYTSKDKKRTLKVIGKNKYLFKYVITPENVKYGKPNPEGLKKIKFHGKYDYKNMIYIGDTIYDYMAAKKLKIKYFHFKSNFSSNKIYLKRIKVISNFKQLKKIISDNN